MPVTSCCLLILLLYHRASNGSRAWGVGLQLSGSPGSVGVAQEKGLTGALYCTVELVWGIPVTHASKVPGYFLFSMWFPLSCKCVEAPGAMGGISIAIDRSSVALGCPHTPETGLRCLSQVCVVAGPKEALSALPGLPWLVSPFLGLCSPAVASALLSHSHADSDPKLSLQPDLASHPAQWLVLGWQCLLAHWLLWGTPG